MDTIPRTAKKEIRSYKIGAKMDVDTFEDFMLVTLFVIVVLVLIGCLITTL